jgi:hypothetical protein
VAAWWEYTNSQATQRIPMRADAEFDRLLADVAEARNQTREDSVRGFAG